MSENVFMNQLGEMFDTANLAEWFLSVDLLTVVFYVCGVALFYLVMSMALRIMSLLFWPTVVIVGLLFFRNETFANMVTEGVKRMSESVRGDLLCAG